MRRPDHAGPKCPLPSASVGSCTLGQGSVSGYFFLSSYSNYLHDIAHAIQVCKGSGIRRLPAFLSSRAQVAYWFNSSAHTC